MRSVDEVEQGGNSLPWPGVSVVVPVFHSTDSLRALVDRAESVLSSLGLYEIILVDDGSSSSTWSVIQELSTCHPAVSGVRLSRNYGQHSALVAGIREASMPVTVTLDDDLQNPPEEIPKLVGVLLRDDLQVVYGVPESVSHSLGRRVASRLTRSALKSGLGVGGAPDISSFRAFRTQMRDAFAGDVGSNVSLDALLTWGGSRFGSVPVRHEERANGKSNYTFGKLLRFAIDTATGYSVLPLQIASILGFVMALFGLVVLAFVTIRPLVSGQSVPGFPFLAACLAIFSGAQLLTLGIIGEYLARMHFRIMHKPTYVISESTRDAPETS